MAIYELTPDVMCEFAGRIEGLANEYQTIYQSNLLQQLVSTELSAAYKGTDAEVLSQRIRSYETAFKSMKLQLDNYAAFLRSTAGSYDEVRATFESEAAKIGLN